MRERTGIVEPRTGFIDLDAWSAPAIEPPFLAPLIGTGDLCLLVGEAAVGKTTAAISIATGLVVPKLSDRILGGVFTVDPNWVASGPVCVVDGENSASRWNAGLRRYYDAAGVTPADQIQLIKYCEPRELGLPSVGSAASGTTEFVERIAELGGRLLVIDSTLAVLRPADINQPDWVSQKLVPLRSACRERDIAIILLCHPARRKQSEQDYARPPLGTMAQEATADAMIYVSRLTSKHPDGIALTCMKSRRAFWIARNARVDLAFAEGGHYEAINDPRIAWPLEPPSIPQRQARRSPMAERALEVLLGAAGCSLKASDVGEKLDLTPDAAQRHLKRLCEEGRATMEGRGPSARYSAVEHRRSKP